LWSGAGPELIAFFRVVQQRAEERRFQRLRVLAQPADQVSGNEIRGFLGEEDVAVGFAQHIDRNVLQPVVTDQNDNGHVESALADQRNEARHLALRPALAPIQQHATDRGVGSESPTRRHQFCVLSSRRNRCAQFPP
jgi:hypothetical protein